MTRGGSRTRRITGRGQGISVTPSSSSPSSSALPSPVAPTVVSPPIVPPVSTGSPTDLPISSPSDSTVPPTSSSVEGSSIGPDLTTVHVEEGRLIPSHKCSTTMKKIFMQRIYPEGYTWKKIPNEYKESYFEEFKKFYKWDASIDRHVRKAFLAQAGIRKKYKHDMMLQRKRWPEESTEPPVINMSQLYVDVVGGVKKQRIYGLGTKASSFINSNSCSSSSTSQFHQDTMKEMLDTIRVEMEAQMEAKLQAKRNQMQAQIASLMDELRRNGIIPTTSTPQPPTTEGHSVNSNDEDLGDD
nr:probable inactive protein kinase DDB_G0270444 [Ipomoea batatas]